MTIEAVSAERQSYAFLHLSDIHFGQEKGGEVFINNAIKEDLIVHLEDIAKKRADAQLMPLDGILVTGDIAFSGKQNEYKAASEWLADIARTIGCDVTAVHVVPGNHDVDRKRVSPSVRDMIDKIIEGGQPALDEFLDNPSDTERLYERFSEYRVFAAGYGCTLDMEGGDAGKKQYPLRNGLSLHFVGMNSALVCRGGIEDKEPGKLVLGAKQQNLIPRRNGVEHIILMHHPISWLADGVAAWNYFKTRARVFISGHEHMPSVVAETVDGNGAILRIDSGAVVPPNEADGYGYTFNVIEFVLGPNDDELQVSVQGHIWDKDITAFREDTERFCGAHETNEVLPCPMFARAQGATEAAAAAEAAPATDERGVVVEGPAAAGEEAVMSPVDTENGAKANEHRLAELRLRYFHKLTQLQRLQVLIEMNVLPADWEGPTTATIELSALEALAKMGRLTELEAAINNFDRE